MNMQIYEKQNKKLVHKHKKYFNLMAHNNDNKLFKNVS